jgi:hypothetical protein
MNMVMNMRLSRLLLVACVALATLVMALGYASGGALIGSGVAIVAGILWLAGHLIGRLPSVNHIGWLFFIALAGVGMWSGLPALLMLMAFVASLCAWDLASFELRMSSAGRVDNAAQMERRHLRMLGIVALGSVALAGPAVLIRVQYSFGLAALLAALAILVLSQAARLVARQTKRR